MSRRIPLLSFFGSSASDDDFADRLNYKYTVAILVVFAFIVTNKHFGHNQVRILRLLKILLKKSLRDINKVFLSITYADDFIFVRAYISRKLNFKTISPT